MSTTTWSISSVAHMVFAMTPSPSGMIDTGATNHMIVIHSLFLSYVPSTHGSVCAVYGSITQFMGVKDH